MESSAPTLDGLFARLIEALEGDPAFDLEGFLRAHPEHAARLRQRVDSLRRAGLLGPGPGQVLHTMRARFGVTSAVRTAAPEPAGSATPGELLPSRLVGGRYRILDEIGRGGMGRVFRALDVDLGREVALKVVDLEPAAGGDARERRAYLKRFLSEAQVTAQLEHPAIVPLHDIGIDRTGQLYYTMKRVEGRTLESWIAEWHAGPGRPRVPLPELLRVVLQICDALALAHARGVVHRDLKPSNVMLGRFGEVHVMDWGLAKLLGRGEPAAPGAPAPRERVESPTRLGQVLGTPSHMAPEQARGDPELIDARADVYGVGAILCHALTGAPPNRRETGAHDWAGVPPELAAVCRKALEPERERRYAAVAELAADLRAFLEMRRGSAWRDGPWRRTVKLVRRRAASVAGLGAALLAVIAALTVALYAQQKERAEESETRAGLLASLLDTEKALVAEEQKRAAAERARADAERERALLTSLIPGLLTRDRGHAMESLYAFNVPDVLPICREILAELERVGLELDGDEPVDAVLERLELVREVSPAAHARAVAAIESLAHMVERPQLYCVMLFCEGRFPRAVSEKRRPLWEQYCREFPELLRFLPRLDALVDGLTIDPWRRGAWQAYRARYRDLAPWPDGLLSATPERAEDALFLATLLAGDADRRVKLRAATLLEAAVDGLPEEFWARFLLYLFKTDRALPELFDPGEALEHAFQAYAIRPDSPLAVNNLGAALLYLDRDAEALAVAQRAVRLGPRSAEAWGNLGEALRRLGRLTEAMAAQDRSVELAPRAIAFFNRSLVHDGLGDSAAAERDLRRALELDPDYLKAWLRLATLLEQQGRIDDALLELDRGLEQIPDSPDLLKLRDELLDAMDQ